MSTVRYTVMDGELLSENRDATKRDYVPDPLGSTIALLDATQTQTDTFAYWPYGEVASRTGGTATPFQYGGTLGYYTEGSSGRLYVRARHYSSTSGRWISEDPIGFDGGDYNLYRYAQNSPTSWYDPTGTKPVYPNDPRWPKPPDYYPPDPGLFDCLLTWPPSPLNYGESRCIKEKYDRAVEAQKRLDPKKFPPGNGGPRDAFRHCVGACLVLRECGENAYKHGIIDHEINNAWWAKGSWNPTYSPMDLANDAEGLQCFKQVKDSKITCESCCLAKLKADNLYILPSKYRSKK